MDIKAEVNMVNQKFNSVFESECTEQLVFSISDKMLKLIESQEPSNLWGNISQMALYMADQALEMQWIPRKLIYAGHDMKLSPEENGAHKFYWKCQNRSFKNFWGLIQNMVEATPEKPMKISQGNYQTLVGLDVKNIVTEYNPPSGIRGTWRGIPFVVID